MGAYIHTYIGLHKKDLYSAHTSNLSLCLCADGRLFHIFGPEVEKLLSPNRVFVRGT